MKDKNGKDNVVSLFRSAEDEDIENTKLCIEKAAEMELKSIFILGRDINDEPVIMVAGNTLTKLLGDIELAKHILIGDTL